MLQKQGKSASFRSQILFSFISSRTWKANCMLFEDILPRIPTTQTSLASFNQIETHEKQKQSVAQEPRMFSRSHYCGSSQPCGINPLSVSKNRVKKSCDKIERLDQWTTRSYIADWLKFLLIFNPRTAGGLSQPRTAGGGGAHCAPPG